MAKRRFSGLPAPLVEAEEQPLKILIQFSEAISPDELSVESRDIVIDLEDMGFEITEMRVSTSTPGENWLRLELAITNIDIQRLEDIRDRVIGVAGYQNLVVSCVPLKDIERFMR